MAWEHVAAVPASGQSLVIVDGSLPRIRIDRYRLADALDAFEPVIGRPVFLRVGADAHLGDDEHARLLEFDRAVDGDTLPLAAATPDLAPPELRDAFARWLDEQRGAPPPPLRPPWSRPGWYAKAEAWAGQPLRPLALWPLSAVLVGDGVVFKAAFSLFHHEPSLTESLAHEHPGLVPEMIRINKDEGWMLMRPLPMARADVSDALATLDEIGRRWRNRHDDLYALGAPDRSLATLERSLPSLVPQHTDAFARVVRELSRRGEPETIVHGDFHRGNVTLVDGRAVIFDWSDACIGHQACDRVLFTDDYTDPVEAIPACLHQAASYIEIGKRIAPDDRFWLGESTGFWRDRAVSLLT